MEQKTIQIGVGVNYYGSIHPEHAPCLNELLRSGIPAVQIRACAYPEMGLAEITRQALEQQCQVVVFITHDMVFKPEDVRKVAEIAVENNAVVTASYGRPKTGASRRYSLAAPKIVELEVIPETWVPSKMTGMSFTAVPLTIIKALAESDDRQYTNSSIVDTGFSKDSRPFFSPWQKSPGTLHTVPVAEGFYSNPDTAFLLRVVRAGFKIYDCPSVNPRCISSSTYSVSIFPGDPEKRSELGVKNYVVCVPSFGALDLDQQQDLFELTKAGMAVIDLNGCPYLDLARSELVRIARNELKADGVFFLDHDIIFRPLDLIALCKEAEARQHIVAAVYQMRGSGKNLIGAPATEVGDELHFFEGGTVIPGLYSGLGFAAIPIGVFEALDAHLPLLEGGMPGLVRPYFALDTNANFYSGEDVSFCGRVQGLAIRHFPTARGEENINGVEWDVARGDVAPTNYRVLLDTRVRIFHRGSYDYGLEDKALIVPRYSSLLASMKATREEVRSALKTVDQIPESDVAFALEDKV